MYGQKVKNVRAVILKFVKELEKEITVEKVILFGSYARGNPRNFSDIDILVVSPDFEGGTQEDFALLDRVARKTNLLIEAIPYTTSDFENYEKGDFVHEIRNTGKIILDKAA